MRQQDRELLDSLNAKLCEVVVKAPYFIEPTKMNLEEFRIVPGADDQPNDERKKDPPVKSLDDVFERWARQSSGG